MNSSLQEMLEVIDTLLDEEKGCPWDKKQSSITLCKYIIDEVYELIDAVHNNDITNIIEEYGDVLFLLFMLLHIFSKERKILLDESLRSVVIKMKHRHPYVFGTTPVPQTDEEFAQLWEEQKRTEKGKEVKKSLFSSIPKSTHPFTKALQICKKLPYRQYPSIKTYEDYKEAISAKKDIETMFLRHFYSLLEDAKMYNIDIQSLLLKENHSIIEHFAK